MSRSAIKPSFGIGLNEECPGTNWFLQAMMQMHPKFVEEGADLEK